MSENQTHDAQTPKRGRGRPPGARNKAAHRLQAMQKLQVERPDYRPKHSPEEVLQRALDGDTRFTPAQIERARDLLPYRVPKLSAVVVRQAPPPAPRAEDFLRGVPAELVEVLDDAMRAINEWKARQPLLQIEGAVIDADEE